MAGLVGLVVIVVPLIELWSAVEELRQLLHEEFFPTQQIHQAGHVVRYEPAILKDAGLHSTVAGEQAFPGDGLA